MLIHREEPYNQCEISQCVSAEFYLEKTNTPEGVLAKKQGTFFYCEFSPGTRQIASNARFTQGPLSARQIFFIQGQCDSSYVLLGYLHLLSRGFL